jgi:hypothetical protein
MVLIRKPGIYAATNNNMRGFDESGENKVMDPATYRKTAHFSFVKLISIFFSVRNRKGSSNSRLG